MQTPHQRNQHGSMAKKKKAKGRDARGYGQAQPSSGKKPASVSTTAAVPNHTLLSQLKEDFVVPSAAATDTDVQKQSDRFASKLGSIVERLERLQFKEEQIDRVALALAYSITLDTALDWLCLHCSSEELPSLFVDTQMAREDDSSNSTLTVLKLTKPDYSELEGGPNEPNDDKEDGFAAKDAAETKRKEKAKEDERAKAAQKAWLLEKYQYEEGNEHKEQQQQQSEGSDRKGDSETLSPEETKLRDLEKEVLEMEADVGNEANNYMRSKQEIQQLRRDLKQKRQMVQGMKRRIEKEKARKQKEQDDSQIRKDDDERNDKEEEEVGTPLFGSNDDSDEEEYHAGLFDNTNSTQSPAPDTTSAISRISCSVPDSWTGSTPRRTLDETSRKQKLLKPKYTKLQPPNDDRGYRLALSFSKKSGKPDKIFEVFEVDFEGGSDLQEYLALQALYDMDPTLKSLHKMFPPDFSNLWLSWQHEVELAKSEDRQALEAARKKRLDHLLSLIKSNSTILDSGSKAEVVRTETREELVDESADVNDEDGVDDWEKSVGDTLAPTPTTIGKQLQQAFRVRRSSLEYQRMLKARQALPMSSYREQVLKSIRDNPVTVLCAETGAGKTTQCPQYILEEALSQGYGDSCHIVVTQPRRIAATSVAERVSEEMCETAVGDMIGYSIRNETKRSANTMCMFCTTGVVIRRLQEDGELAGVTHVIVDEVHERQQQTDILLIVLRKLLQGSRPDLKVILMSATLDTELFCSFFHGAPLISVPGRTFPVAVYHLEDVIDAMDYVIEEGSRYAVKSYSSERTTLWVTAKGGEKRKENFDMDAVTETVSGLYAGYKMSTQLSMERVNEDTINFDIIDCLFNFLFCQSGERNTLLPPEGADLSNGSVLVFLPGLGEIRALVDTLGSNRKLMGIFEIIPLHSSLSSKDQRRAFAQTPKRKLILSSNIAETSVTIPDVVMVVDAGRVREVRRNKRTSTSELVTTWCSKASAKQRAGRAGRVQAGLCLKLYSSQTAQEVMKPITEPELRRVPLEEVCLSILASGFADSCREFLSLAPQPPSDDAVKAATDILKSVGAVRTDDQNSLVERLTPLGQHLAKIPLDVRLGKMLIFASIFRCIDKVLTVAASLSSKSPFAAFVAEASTATAKHRSFFDHDSDFMTLVNVWDGYAQAAKESTRAAAKFCERNFLNLMALREISESRSTLVDLLCSIGFLDNNLLTQGKNRRVDPDSLKKSLFNENGNDSSLVHAVVFAGLHPNVAALKQPVSGQYELYHKQERLFFHKSSVNYNRRYTESWIGFHEKFGPPNRVSVSTTCYVHPFSLILFGNTVDVKHLDRLVVVDGWIVINMAAATAVAVKDFRRQLDEVLQGMFNSREDKAYQRKMLSPKLIETISSLLAT